MRKEELKSGTIAYIFDKEERIEGAMTIWAMLDGEKEMFLDGDSKEFVIFQYRDKNRQDKIWSIFSFNLAKKYVSRNRFSKIK